MVDQKNKNGARGWGGTLKEKKKFEFKILI